MALTTAQLTALAASINADPVLSALQPGSEAIDAIIAAYKMPATLDYFVWRGNVSIVEVFGAINWANLTPADFPPLAANPALPTNAEFYALILWFARAHFCQSKQINAQIMLQGQQIIDARLPNERNGIKDALQKLLSGANGAQLDAGWAAVKVVLARNANRLERLFAPGVGTGLPATPDTLVLEGEVTYGEIAKLKGW